MRYPWQCSLCDTVVEITRPMADSAVPPDWEVACLCKVTAASLRTWRRVYEMPGLTKATYVDGMRKFPDLREASKLQREANKSKSDQKKDEIATEIKKIGVRVQ